MSGWPPESGNVSGGALRGRSLEKAKMKSHRILSTVFVMLALALSSLSVTGCTSPTDASSSGSGSSGGSGGSGGY